MNTRYREASLEADGGALRLRGTAIRYGDIAHVPYRERVLPRAFGDVTTIDAILNRQHQRNRAIARTGGGGLVLTDSPTKLTFEAELVETQEAVDTVRLVRSGILRGASIEYGVPINGERLIDGTVVVHDGRLSGIGVVDDPAYPESTIEARARIRQNGQGLSGEFFYSEIRTVSATGGTRKHSFQSGSLDFALDDPEREVNVTLGRDYSNIIGSKLAGSARFTNTAESLRVDIDTLPSTTAVADFRAQLAAESIAPSVDLLFSTDGIPDAFEDIPEPGNPGVLVRNYKNVVLQAMSIVSRTPRGLEANEVLLRNRRLLLCL